METPMQYSQLNYQMKSPDMAFHPIFARKKFTPELDSCFQHDFNTETTEIDYDSLITEDDTPVDNFYCEKQMRLLPESLKSSWDRKKPYIVAADVGIYEDPPGAVIVPDVLLSLDVQYATNIWKKKHRCYMIGIFKKPPELVIEIVSNKTGEEDTAKLRRYESMGIKYYVIFDPCLHILDSKIQVYKLINKSYVFYEPELNECVWFYDLNIGMIVQYGIFEEMEADWLRWCDENGNILLSGYEHSRILEQKMVSEKKRFEQKMVSEKKRLEQKMQSEKERADALEKELAELKARIINK